MAINTVSYNKIFSKIQTTLPSYIDSNNLNILRETFDYKLSEVVKCFVEAAFRDYVLKSVCLEGRADLEQIKIVVKMCVEGVRQDLCLPTLPVLILSDTFDCITIQQCEELFEFVESNVAIWKEELFFSHCKNQVLRMCNDVLRRLSRSQNTIFCGRILLFLARFFPFSERSGLNLISEFNLENVTIFTDPEILEIEVEEDLGTEEGKTRPSLDYTLYTKFWALQDFFRNPSQCFQKSPWKLFIKYADDILEAFLSFKLDTIQASKGTDASVQSQRADTQKFLDQEDQYFPKYLTNQKLLDLQFSDSNFRRYILVQMLILAQYLTSNIKFKQENLNDEQLGWVKKMEERSYSLLAETPANGREFVDVVKSILKREEIWSKWKNSGCPEMRRPGPGAGTKRKAAEEEEDSECGQPKRKEQRRRLGELVREADSRRKYVMGNAEMTRLWNISPNNMEACQKTCRDFVPSLETYFSAAIEQVLATKDKDKEDPKSVQRLVSDSNFGWRGLRLLASKSPHFFTNSGNCIATLPEYLTNMIKKVAKDLPSQQLSMEVKEEEEEKEEEIGMLEPSEGVKEEDEEEDEEDEEVEGCGRHEESRPMEEEERRRLARALATCEGGGDALKALCKKMDFGPDELEYFVGEGGSLEDGIEIMLERWQENEKESKENLIYMLEGLKMKDVVRKVFST